MSTVIPRHTALVLFAALALGGCKVARNDPSLIDSLVGTDFTAVSAEGFDLPPASNVRIVFDTPGESDPDADGQLGVSGGCNLIGGAFTLDDDVLVARGGWMQTEMACDQPLMDLDNDLIGLLDSRPSLVRSGTTLRIVAGDDSGASLTLTEA